MSITLHDDIELMIGDDWTIDGSLTDPNTGTPLDLTTATLEWALIDPSGALSAAATAATISVIAPSNQGQIQIIVPRTATALLEVGRYQDQLRVTVSARITEWRGSILTAANAFFAEDDSI